MSVSDLEDIEFLWDDPYLNMDADYRPGLNTPFAFPFWRFWERFNDWKPNSDWRKAREEELNSTSTTPVSERPTQSPVLMRSCPFGTKFENVPD